MSTEMKTPPKHTSDLVSFPKGPWQRWLLKRRAAGGDRLDEVWDEVYMVAAEANNEHQQLGRRLANAIEAALADPRAQVFHSVNVSDREDWHSNYRVPDVAAFLPGGLAEDRQSHWLGGPDFAVEIVSRNDRSRQKLDFYAKVRVRENLYVNRGRNWSLELFRREGDEWKLVGKIRPESHHPLVSMVLPVTFRLLEAKPRPQIQVSLTGTTVHWLA